MTTGDRNEPTTTSTQEMTSLLNILNPTTQASKTTGPAASLADVDVIHSTDLNKPNFTSNQLIKTETTTTVTLVPHNEITRTTSASRSTSDNENEFNNTMETTRIPYTSNTSLAETDSTTYTMTIDELGYQTETITTANVTNSNPATLQTTISNRDAIRTSIRSSSIVTLDRVTSETLINENTESEMNHGIRHSDVTRENQSFAPDSQTTPQHNVNNFNNSSPNLVDTSIDGSESVTDNVDSQPLVHSSLTTQIAQIQSSTDLSVRISSISPHNTGLDHTMSTASTSASPITLNYNTTRMKSIPTTYISVTQPTLSPNTSEIVSIVSTAGTEVNPSIQNNNHPKLSSFGFYD
mgnify:FL=1